MSKKKPLLEQAYDLGIASLTRSLTRPELVVTTMQGEKINIPPIEDGDLTEICQLFGHSLYVRLDQRDPKQAKAETHRIRSTIIEMFDRAGWIERMHRAELLDANTKAGEG